MEWLNYHHLLYFWVTAREGSLSRASAELHLAQSTVSKQIHRLEEGLGHRLFAKEGRRLRLTETGRMVYRYAEGIFGLGRELMDVLADYPAGRPLRVSVGIADVVPKMVAQRFIEPLLRGPEPVRIVCREGQPNRLLAELAMHELDVILTDAQANPQLRGKTFNHPLGECGVAFFAGADQADRYRSRFPASLNQAPMLLPTENTALRRSLDQWFETSGIRPQVVGEFEDSALLMAFGCQGAGLFPAPSVVVREAESQYPVRAVGRVPQIRERYYAVTVERRLKHPAVVAICQGAQRIFAQSETGKTGLPGARQGASRRATSRRLEAAGPGNR
jgi:LysR family transcriptional regulator, transcriptional activator of nhaA